MSDVHLTDADLDLYAIGGLPAERIPAFEAHVRDCTACADRLRREARLETALTEVARASARDRVTRTVRPWRRRAAVYAGLSAALGLAASLLFVFQRGLPLATTQTSAAAPVQTASPQNDHPTLALQLQKKARAFAVPVQGAARVAANDHVDLLATFKHPDTGLLVTVTLLQNVVVLQTAQSGADGGAPGQALALLVLPEEAEMIQETIEVGAAVHVTLRNVEDIDIGEERGYATAETILAGEREHALFRIRQQWQPAAAPASDRAIRPIRGQRAAPEVALAPMDSEVGAPFLPERGEESK